MEITVKIDNKDYVAKYNGATALLYRDTFRADILLDVTEAKKKVDAELINLMAEGKDLTDFEVQDIIIRNVTTELLEKMLWVCLKSADKSIKDYRSFISEVDNYNTMIGASINVYELIVYGNQPTVEIEKSEETSKKKKKKKKKKPSQD